MPQPRPRSGPRLDPEDRVAVTGELPAVRPWVDDRAGRPPGGPWWARLAARGLDLRNTWQVAVGAILLPLGVAVILLGWAGAANGRVDQQQIPYLISGGLLGLAIVIVGCFFFWAHWLYRIYDQADLHHQAAMREQTELIRALLEGLVPRSEADAASVPARRARNGRAGREPASGPYVATPTGSNFHVPACPVVASRGGTLRSVSPGEAEQMKPCRICEPLGEE